MDAFMTKYFIKFEEKAAIEIIEKFATEMDWMLVLGNLTKVKREPIKERLSYYPTYYYNQGY